MGLSAVVVNISSAGIGRRPINTDKISGLLFYNSTPPSGFASTAIQKVFSLAQAEGLGIAKGSSNYAVEWYHVSEFFRANPEGELWIGYFAVPGGSYTFAEITTMCNFAGGEIKQLGVYANALTYAAAQVTTIGALTDALRLAGMPVVVLYAANMAAITAISGWAAIATLRTSTAKGVTVVTSQDGNGAGKALFTSKGYSITTLGHALGFMSKAAVNQSIGYPAQFNASNGVENEVVAMANGDLITALGDTALGSVKDKGYLVMRKYVPKLAGSYYERVPSAVPATDNFAWFDNVRPIDKAIRLVQSALTPQLQAVLVLNANGTLSTSTVGFFLDLAQTPLDQMVADTEISAGLAQIDPTQNVQATSNLIVTIKIVETATAETITVNIGLTLSL